jgi:hypothetical protein
MDRITADRYPKPIFQCEDLILYVLGPGKNPMVEVRRRNGTLVGGPSRQLMSIVAHIDLDEWEPVADRE